MNIIERIESEYGELGQTEKNYLLQNLHYFTDEEITISFKNTGNISAGTYVAVIVV